MKKILNVIFFMLLLAVSSVCEGAIVFLHIPKTAGTTLMELLGANFNGDEIYPYRKIGGERISTSSLKDVNDVLKSLPAFADKKLVMGHFPYWFLEKKDRNLRNNFVFTVLRDPIARVISHWSYSQSKGEASSPLDIPPNLMCKMLCSDVTLQGDDLLNDAIRNLGKLNFIIFQDDFDNSVRQLFSQLNLVINKNSIPNKNRSVKREISDEMLEKIIELNDLDIRLYEYAQKNLRDQFQG